MKMLGIIAMILLVTVVLVSWGGILTDFEKGYVETGIVDVEPVNSSFKEDYSNRAADIEEDFSPLIDDIEDLGTDDGWFDRIADGAVVLPKLIISIPGMLLATITSASADMVTMLTTIGIPNELVLIGVVLLTLVIIFKIVELIRRYRA